MGDSLSAAAAASVHQSVMQRLYGHFAGHDSTAGVRILLIMALAIAAHVTVRLVRAISDGLILRSHAQRNPFGFMAEKPKFITVTRLIVSAVTFAIYFFGLGLILEEFGVNLTAYLASASIIGLAISFGSQGLIQDIVIGLTLIFLDAMDVGDMVEIYASAPVIGRVDEIGMRFTKLTNVYDQRVFIPNRTIANVSRFPHGGVDAYADALIPAGADPRTVRGILEGLARGAWVQFGGIILAEPVIGAVQTPPGGGWSYLRVHFRIWPGQGTLIETTFRQQVVMAMRKLDPAYADWQVPVTYRAASTAPASFSTGTPKQAPPPAPSPEP
jgi:small conductance mechanosensitive channel